MSQLSDAAKNALMNVGTNRIGAIVHPNLPAGVRMELYRAGFIGDSFGLTVAGSVARQRIVSAALDAAF